MKKAIYSFIYYRLLGWKTNVTVPNYDKCVICAAPHTTNLDLFIGKLFYGAIGRKTSFMMKKEWLKETMEIMNVVKCNPMIYWDGKIRCVHIDDWMIHSASTSHKELEVVKLEDFYAHENAKIMFRMKEEDMLKAEAWVKEHPNPYYHGFKTQSTLLEFCDKRINKGYGLQKICELNDLDIKDVMAFGDTSNDNDMLKVAGCGVCMINGTDDTKACANAITKQDNEHDGLAIYLEESGILC